MSSHKTFFTKAPSTAIARILVSVAIIIAQKTYMNWSSLQDQEKLENVGIFDEANGNQDQNHLILILQGAIEQASGRYLVFLVHSLFVNTILNWIISQKFQHYQDTSEDHYGEAFMKRQSIFERTRDILSRTIKDILAYSLIF
jgi:hypothetical protein